MTTLAAHSQEPKLAAVTYWGKPDTPLPDSTAAEADGYEKPEPLSVVWTLDSLLDHCCTKTGVTPQELCSKTKKRAVTAVRGLFCYLACKLTTSTLASIGEKLNQPHDMVIYYRNTVQGYVESRDRRTIMLLAQLEMNTEFLLNLE